VRPATPLICAFIDAHRDRFGVAPIRRALSVHGIQFAPRTYWAHLKAAPSKRALWDATITGVLAGIYETGPDGRRPPHRPLRTLADLEDITPAWVHWSSNHRLMHRLGRRPPAEAEAGYDADLQADQKAGTQKTRRA